MLRYGEILSHDVINEIPLESRDEILELKLDETSGAIDVKKMADILGIEIRYIPGDVSGKLVPDEEANEGYHIEINNGELPVRQRFTLAHELGHFLIGKGEDKVVKNRALNVDDYTPSERVEEIKVNKFAANLLMPKKLIISLTKKWVETVNKGILEVDDDGLDNLVGFLSENLEASKQAVQIRLKSLRIIDDGQTAD